MEAAAWWEYYKTPSNKHDYVLQDYPKEFREAIQEWTGNSPLLLSVLFKEEFQTLTPSEALEKFCNPDLKWSAFSIVEKEIRSFVEYSFKDPTLDRSE